MLIVIEGYDGCGKGTAAKLVADYFGADVLEFPDRSTPVGREIDAHLKGEGTLTAMQFQALQTVNKFEHFRRLSNAAFDDNQRLVLSRYWQSAWAYGQHDGLDDVWLESIHVGLPAAQLNVLIDVSPEECLRRRAARDGALPPERYEGKLETAREITALYRRLWQRRHGNRWVVVDGDLVSPQSVCEQIIRAYDRVSL